jgi:glycosyltransferase involved in cell wall biosynthesis
MKNCTLVYSFYKNQSAVDAHCAIWNTFDDSIKQRLCIIVVDDGSTPPLKFNINPSITNIHLRVTNDIRWNQPGAKNLAMKFVPTDWAFITDADFLLSRETVLSLLEFTPEEGAFYQFNRFNNDQFCHPHPNTFLLRKSDFFSVDGYDEDFCGNYGFDDLFFVEKMVRNYQLKVHDGIVLRNDTGFQTPDVIRNHQKNKKLFKKKRQQLLKNRYQPSGMIRFHWEIVHFCPPILQ